MNSMKSIASMFALFLVVGLLVLAPFAGQQAQAQREVDARTQVYRENSDINKMFHKLGRGFVNVFTGWVEVPKNVAQEWRRTDPFTGTITGFFKGFAWAVARTFAGFYEIVSFPFPVPSEYQPVMEPEFILPTVWGERLPIFQDEFVGTGDSIDAAMDYQTARPARSY